MNRDRSDAPGQTRGTWTGGLLVRRLIACAACAGLALLLASPDGAGASAHTTHTQPATDDSIAGFGGEKAFTRPKQDAVMGLSIATTIREVLVKGGDRVKKGQVLVRGDDAEELALLKAQQLRANSSLPVDRAEKAVELQRFEYDQLLNLQREGGGSPQELERARLSLEAAKIDYETAKLNQEQEVIQVDRVIARVDRYRILAPFDGEVDTVFMDNGQSVTDNDKVLRVVEIDPLEIDVAPPIAVTLADPATGRDAVRVGQPAWVLMELPGEPRVHVGKVTEVSPVADPRSGTRRVRVEVANPEGIVAGLTAWVRFTEPQGIWKERIVGRQITKSLDDEPAEPGIHEVAAQGGQR